MPLRDGPGLVECGVEVVDEGKIAAVAFLKDGNGAGHSGIGTCLENPSAAGEPAVVGHAIAVGEGEMNPRASSDRAIPCRVGAGGRLMDQTRVARQPIERAMPLPFVVRDYD